MKKSRRKSISPVNRKFNQARRPTETIKRSNRMMRSGKHHEAFDLLLNLAKAATSNNLPMSAGLYYLTAQAALFTNQSQQSIVFFKTAARLAHDLDEPLLASALLASASEILNDHGLPLDIQDFKWAKKPAPEVVPIARVPKSDLNVCSECNSVIQSRDFLLVKDGQPRCPFCGAYSKS